MQRFLKVWMHSRPWARATGRRPVAVADRAGVPRADASSPPDTGAGRCRCVARTLNNCGAAGEGNDANPRDPNPMGIIVEITADSAAGSATGGRRESPVLRVEARTATRAVRAGSRIPREHGSRHTAGHRWPAARECPRIDTVRRSTVRYRMKGVFDVPTTDSDY